MQRTLCGGHCAEDVVLGTSYRGCMDVLTLPRCPDAMVSKCCTVRSCAVRLSCCVGTHTIVLPHYRKSSHHAVPLLCSHPVVVCHTVSCCRAMLCCLAVSLSSLSRCPDRVTDIF